MPDQVKPPSQSPPASASASTKVLPTILVVDDNPGDIELVRIAFEMSDMPVRMDWVTDGHEAMRRLERTVDRVADLPELILLDLNMPRANGFEVLRFLRDQGLTERVPVVVLSTSRQAEDRRRCLELGAREFRTKPELIRDLVDMVRSLQPYLTTK
jgi:CheY-like chemotaxis protein